MADPLAITISALALAVSATTAWLTLFRRGSVKMTHPTVIYFGPDTPPARDYPPPPKIYLRALLFATSKRGRVIQSMHVRVTRNETHQNFNIWVHSESKALVRGSGLFVGESGIAADHHFLTPRDVTFRFVEGLYRIEIFAHLLGDKQRTLLFSQTLEITRDLSARLEDPGTGLYFDWGPDSLRYIPHIQKRLPSPEPRDLLEPLLQRAAAHPDKQPTA